VTAVLAYLETEGEPVTTRPLAAPLPDPDDLPFLEVATQAKAWLITGNADHFPIDARGEVRVFVPAEFLVEWQQRNRT
jgi:predicted nucleic acid-binding protein